jgi:radical SAM protein with 4Fe4S-binding SPASM domain
MVLKHVTIDGIRLHLQVDESKVLVNGYYSVHLNASAKNMLERFIDACKLSEKSEEIIPKALDAIQERYPKIPRDTLDQDLRKLIEVINFFGRGIIPCHLDGLEHFDNGTKPQRMDLALTYRCTNKCPHCYLPKNESKTELTTSDWKKVINKLWEIGVPQIAFTGGECTLREDLPELVKYAEEMITGIITNGTQITPELAKKLRENELDWIQITLESHKFEVHDEMQGRPGAFAETVQGIKNCVDAGIAVSINSTLTTKNAGDLIDLIKFAKRIGVKYVSTNALINSGRGISAKQTDELSEKDLSELLPKAQEVAKSEEIEFNFFLPTCYKEFDPVKCGFGQRCCSACNINMLIEPDGTVIPCQSWTDQKLGNILTDPWEKIWDSEISKKIRSHGHASEECKSCEYFDTCGGGCPLNHINGGEKL